jgi:hypothetical protein
MTGMVSGRGKEQCDWLDGSIGQLEMRESYASKSCLAQTVLHRKLHEAGTCRPDSMQKVVTLLI